jgi:hypothetical protein
MSRIVYVHDYSALSQRPLFFATFWGLKISMILTPCHPKKLRFELISQNHDMRLVQEIDHRWHGGFLMTIFNAFQGKYPDRL